VKAFNATFAGTLVAGEVDGQQLDVLIAGDDQAAQADGVAAGLRRWPLEQLGFLHISLQQPLDLGFASAIKLHS
jgi:8-hydroxy-5-deazaflavin:NADPH oxidoreductase